MLRFLGLYGINAVSFLTNVSAIFIYSALAGPAGYGTYGIYVALMSIFLISEISLLKTALAIAEKARAEHEEAVAQAMAARFLRFALIPVTLGAAVLVSLGNLAFPPDALVQMGGTQIALVVVAEHLLSYPANWLSFRLARTGRFNAVYGLRLLSTLLRHGFAWAALLITGSIELAIIAIVLKGAVLLALSLFWLRVGFPRAVRVEGPSAFNGLPMFSAFMATAFALLAIQEIPSIYIARTFGREVLGNYRLLYDLVAAVWFVATIYPTVLFSYLLPRRGQFDVLVMRKRIKPLSDALLFFHLSYCNGVCMVLAILALLNIGLFSAQMPFAFALTAAVSLLGYSRFLIEAIQALGRSREVVFAVAITGALLAGVLLTMPVSADMRWIGWVWLLGQFVLAILLRLIIARATHDFGIALRDVAIIAAGFSILAFAQPLVSTEAVAALGALLALACGVLSIVTLWRFYIFVRSAAG